MPTRGESKESALKHDIESYEKLYAELFVPLALKALEITQSQQAAEDIVQELFIDLWQHPKQLEHPQALRSYLFNAVRNRAINYYRTYQRGAPAEFLDDLHSPIDEDSLEVAEEAMHLRIKLLQALDTLPERCREVMLHLLDDKKPEEVSQIMQLSIHTIASQKRHAIMLLRRLLGRQ